MRAKKVFGSILLFLGSLSAWITLLGILFPHLLIDMQAMLHLQSPVFSGIFQFWHGHFELVLLLGVCLIGISLLLLFSATVRQEPPFPFTVSSLPVEHAPMPIPSASPFYSEASHAPHTSDPFPLAVRQTKTVPSPNVREYEADSNSPAQNHVIPAPTPPPSPRIVSTMGKKRNPL